ncbi:MAG: nucleotidyltransferase domain-containing protein [Hyphomicrobiaceae bacterium]
MPTRIRAVSVAQGGSFETGALTGAVAAGSSLLMDSSGVMGHSGDGVPENVAARTAVAAVAGGTASVLAGGKFANGAITGAFAQLYNADGIGKSIAIGGGRALGAIFGGVVGSGAAGLCTAGTYGACGAVTPGIIMTGVVGGALVGGQTAGVIYDFVTDPFGSAVYSDAETGPVAGGGASVDNLSPGDISRIQNAADRYGTKITVVGSRAAGTAGPNSDWDYILEGKSPGRIGQSLPGGSRGLGEPRAQDFDQGPVRTDQPHITFTPR